MPYDISFVQIMEQNYWKKFQKIGKSLSTLAWNEQRKHIQINYSTAF